uniref:Uncharacterized protein n=1 Tax=Piliocolobus tephrosceles TaxID=591936 RepID=A0A8C9I159_9PRIM
MVILGLFSCLLAIYSLLWIVCILYLLSIGLCAGILLLFVQHLLPHLLVIQPLFICGEPIPCGLGEYMTRPGLLSPTAS